MHVELLVFLRRFEFEKVFKRAPYGKRKRRRLLETDPAMTQRTQRELPIARQPRRLNNRLVQRLRTVRRVQLQVLFAWSMTLLARDSERVAAAAITICHARVRNRCEERRKIGRAHV